LQRVIDKYPAWIGYVGGTLGQSDRKRHLEYLRKIHRDYLASLKK
jgi:hypothetical protein